MRLTQELLKVTEAKNHLGETTYSSFASWKQACKKKDPSVWFEGDKDIAQAMVGPQPYVRGKTKAIGEWDGNEGSVYNEQVKEDAEYAKKLVRGEKYGPGVLNKIDQFITWKLLFQKTKNRFLPVDQATKQLKLAGFSGEQIHKIRDAAAQAGLAAMEYVMKKYPDRVPEKYTGPNDGAFQVYDLYLNIGEDIRDEFNEKFQKLFDLKIKKIENQLKVIKESKEEEEGQTADKGEIGDTVRISGNVEFKDSVGEIVSFGKDKKFVVVKLFGKNTQHSFHSSDVTLEQNAEDEEEDTDDNDTKFYVAIYDEDEHKSFIGSVSKEGGKWHETAEKGEEPYAWGGSSYMSYLSAQEVMRWIHKDYGRRNEVAGPFNTLEDAEEYVEHNWGSELTEGVRDTFHLSPAIGPVTKKFKSFVDFKAALTAEYGNPRKRNLPGKIFYLKDGKKLAAWDDYENIGIVYYKEKAPVDESLNEDIWDKKFTDFDTWKKAVLHSYPAQAKKMKFKGRFEGGKHTISAEVSGEDRCYGVWDGEEDYGKVLSEAKANEWIVSLKGTSKTVETFASGETLDDAFADAVKREPALKGVAKDKLIFQRGGKIVSEGKWTVNARTGAKLDPRTGKELPPVEKPVSKKQMFAPKPRLVAAKPDLDKIWRKVEDVVSQIFPDGDPIDYMGPWMRKQGWDYSYVEKAAKKHGYKDVYDYWDDLKKEYGETMQEAVKSKESYNDDDWYEYDPKTMKIVRHSGHAAYRSSLKGSHFDLPNGNKVVKGMVAKHKLQLTESVQSQYMAGQKAAYAGKPASANPHEDKTSFDHKAWKQGHADSYRPKSTKQNFSKLKDFKAAAEQQGLKVVSTGMDDQDWTHYAKDAAGKIQGKFYGSDYASNSNGYINARRKTVDESAVDYDKHSFIGKIRRGSEANTKGWEQFGKSLNVALRTRYREPTEKEMVAVDKMVKNSNRYKNLVDRNLTPAGFPKAKAPHVEKFEKDMADKAVVDKVESLSAAELLKYEDMFKQHLGFGDDKQARKTLNTIRAEIKKRGIK